MLLGVKHMIDTLSMHRLTTAGHQRAGLVPAILVGPHCKALLLSTWSMVMVHALSARQAKGVLKANSSGCSMMIHTRQAIRLAISTYAL